MKQRETYLDLAAGIMTIWVMVFHALYPMYGHRELAVVPWFYYFMPWFFYKAGMMYHPKDTAIEWSNGLKKLMLTFAIWSLIGWFAHIVWHWFVGGLTWRIAIYTPLRSLFLKAELPLNGALWFLPILFLVRVIGNWLLQKRIHMGIIAIVSLVVTISIKFLHWRFLPTWISGTMWGLFFFAMGYWFKDYETKPIVIGSMTVLFVVSLFTCIPSVYCGGQPLWAQLLWYPACVCGCITFNNVCRGLVYVESKSPPICEYPFPILTHIGRNAINYYVPHKIIFHLSFNLVILYKEEWYSTWQGLLICLTAYAVLLPTTNFIINKIHNL